MFDDQGDKGYFMRKEETVNERAKILWKCKGNYVTIVRQSYFIAMADCGCWVGEVRWQRGNVRRHWSRGKYDSEGVMAYIITTESADLIAKDAKYEHRITTEGISVYTANYIETTCVQLRTERMANEQRWFRSKYWQWKEVWMSKEERQCGQRRGDCM